MNNNELLMRSPFGSKLNLIENLPTQQSQQDYYSPKIYKSNLENQIAKKSSKLKVQLCRTFLENGYCPYNYKCRFAHGSHELRINNNSNSKYKTKQCTVFFNSGYCFYGDRCNFLHSPINKKLILQNNRKIMIQNFREVIFNSTLTSRLIYILQKQA